MDYSNETARENAVGQNISILDGVEIHQFYPIIDADCSITGWYGADENNDNYVLCDVREGKIDSVGEGCCDAVIAREDVSAALAETL